MGRNGGRQRGCWRGAPHRLTKIIAGPISQEALNPSIISRLVGCQTPARPRPDWWWSTRLPLRLSNTSAPPPHPHPPTCVGSNLRAGYIIHALCTCCPQGLDGWYEVSWGCQCLDLCVCVCVCTRFFWLHHTHDGVSALTSKACVT